MAAPSQENDWTKEDLNSFASSLLAFCTTSFTPCLTRTDPGQSCFSIRLICVSSLLLLISSLHLALRRCKHHGGHPGHIVTSLYCFLGNVCGFTGAVLSRQLQIQVLMGLICAALDLVNFVSFGIPLCFCRNLQAERRQRMIKRRRRAHLLAVSLLGALTGGFLKSGVLRSPAVGWRLHGRRLLYVALQDNADILGYTLGLLSFVISSTSKFPTLYRIRENTFEISHFFWSSMLACCCLLCCCHTSLRHEAQLPPQGHALAADCCLWGLAGSSFLHWFHMGARQKLKRFSLEMESLLGDSSKDKVPVKHHGKQGKHFNLTEMGHYMDVSIDTTKQMYPREVTLVDNTPLSSTAPMVRVDGCDTSCDSSIVNSDLEWDFEEGNVQWSEPNTNPQNGEAFPLQEWPSNPKPFNILTYASCILPQNDVSCNEVVSQSK
ncbi:transmembrane protein 44 isoform X2 [Syngnathus scovelli]|uniref:transmembrane protein 44 isoform X2 n=1 Tax=Syngnathus scovelli TaxID=161590 RepID=UPI00210FCB10|nr:transmembrane protein 44 isoform X2 [Syngnathus scovelli]